MLTGIDHLVIVVNDLQQAAQDYAQLGFTVVPGGKHPVGSHNVLVPFSDGSYLEIIAFYREAADHRWWEPLKKGERLVDFCMQTDDLEGDTRKFRQAGVAINDPVPWSRTRPDGYELKWVLSLAQGEHRGVAPFLIQDVTPREERIPQIFHHANGVTGIDSLAIAVGELSNVEKWYRAVLGDDGISVANSRLGGRGKRYRVGAHTIDFLAPVTPDSHLVEWMTRLGASPHNAVLRSSLSKSLTLDSKFSHGANLSFA